LNKNILLTFSIFLGFIFLSNFGYAYLQPIQINPGPQIYYTYTNEPLINFTHITITSGGAVTVDELNQNAQAYCFAQLGAPFIFIFNLTPNFYTTTQYVYSYNRTGWLISNFTDCIDGPNDNNLGNPGVLLDFKPDITFQNSSFISLQYVNNEPVFWGISRNGVLIKKFWNNVTFIQKTLTLPSWANIVSGLAIKNSTTNLTTDYYIIAEKSGRNPNSTIVLYNGVSDLPLKEWNINGIWNANISVSNDFNTQTVPFQHNGRCNGFEDGFCQISSFHSWDYDNKRFLITFFDYAGSPGGTDWEIELPQSTSYNFTSISLISPSNNSVLSSRTFSFKINLTTNVNGTVLWYQDGKNYENTSINSIGNTSQTLSLLKAPDNTSDGNHNWTVKYLQSDDVLIIADTNVFTISAGLGPQIGSGTGEILGIPSQQGLWVASFIIAIIISTGIAMLLKQWAGVIFTITFISWIAIFIIIGWLPAILGAVLIMLNLFIAIYFIRNALTGG